MGSLNAAIAQGPRPVALDPSLPLQRQIQMGELQAQQQERLAQAATLQAQAQQRQQVLSDSAALHQAFLDTGGDPGAMPQRGAQLGASPAAIQNWQKMSDEHQQAYTLNSKEQNQLIHDEMQDISSGVGGVLAAAPEKRMAQLANLRTQMQNRPGMTPAAWNSISPLLNSTEDRDLQSAQTFFDYNGKQAQIAIDQQKAGIAAAAQATASAKEAREAGAQNRAQALQDFSTIQDQPGLDAWHQRWQASAPTLEASAPAAYSPATVAIFSRQAVPEQGKPEYDIKSAAAAALRASDPQSRGAQVDSIIPPGGNTAALNARTKAQIEAAIQGGMGMSAMQGILKDAAGQIGRTETAVATAKAEMPVKLAEQRAAAMSAFGGIGPGQVPGPSGMTSPPLSGEAYLQTLPAPLAAAVKAVAEGRQPLPLRMTGAAGLLMGAVNQYDPTFTAQRAQIRKDFTTGPDGRNIGALNTAAVHLDQLNEAAQALGNGTFVPGNTLWNATARMFGANAPTNFEQVRAAVAGEMAAALKTTGATDAEIRSMNANIDRSGSPGQLSGMTESNLHILAAKLGTYQERYNAQIPGGDQNWSPVLPTARAVFQKHGINPSQGPSSVTTVHKEGESRVINGMVYVRDGQGNWIPRK